MPGIPGFEQVPRYRELVDRLIAEDAEFVPPGFILELDRPEWAFLKREMLWTTGPLFIAAAAGNFSRAQVFNPSQGARIVVVTLAKLVGALGAGQVDVSVNGALIVAGVVQNTSRDLRVPLNNAGTARPVASTNAVANNLPATSGIIMDRFSVAVGGDGVANAGPWILKPGDTIELTQRTANLAAVFLFAGYERAARAEELAN